MHFSQKSLQVIQKNKKKPLFDLFLFVYNHFNTEFIIHSDKGKNSLSYTHYMCTDGSFLRFAVETELIETMCKIMCSIIESSSVRQNTFTYFSHIHTRIVCREIICIILKAQHRCPFKGELYMTGQQKQQVRKKTKGKRFASCEHVSLFYCLPASASLLLISLLFFVTAPPGLGSEAPKEGFFLADWELEICFSLAFFCILPVVVGVDDDFFGLVRETGLSPEREKRCEKRLN